MADKPISENRIMRGPEVDRRSGISRSHQYYLASKGKFPKRVKIGPRASGIIESEFEEWFSELIAQSGNDDPEAA